jgi:hypothetical protein
MRSSSFDSPKKLRFAADIMETHPYSSNKFLRYSNDALIEVISDQMTNNKKNHKKSNDSLIFAVVDVNEKPNHDCDDLTASCPCINKEMTEFICNGEDFFDEMLTHEEDEETVEMCDTLLEVNIKNAPTIKITSSTPLLSK